MSSPRFDGKLKPELDQSAKVVTTPPPVIEETFPHAGPVSGLATGTAFGHAATAEKAADSGQMASVKATPAKLSKKALKTRREKFETLELPEDRDALSNAWENPSESLLNAALVNAKSFKFFNDLPRDRRKLVQVADIEADQELTDEQWSERKWDHATKWSFSAFDKEKLAERWQLTVDSPIFLAAIVNRPNYEFVKGVSSDQRIVLEPAEIQKKILLDPARYAERRLASITTLTEGDKSTLAAEWKIPEDDVRFKTAIGTEASYEFMRNLPPHNRPVATEEIIRRTTKVSVVRWAEFRQSTLATMTPEDLKAVKEKWGPLDLNDTYRKRVELALGDEQIYQYFRELTDDERRYGSKASFEIRKKPDSEHVKKMKAQAATAPAKPKPQQKSSSGPADPQANKEKLLEWDGKVAELLKLAQQQVSPGMFPPEFSWAIGVETILLEFRGKVERGGSVKNQVAAAKKGITAYLTRESKRLFIINDKSFEKLRKLADLQKQYIEDDTLTFEKYRVEAANQLTAQLTPKDKQTWKRWMNLRIYSPDKLMEELGSVGNPLLKAHMTLEFDGLNLPQVEATTTADQLLNLLFKPGRGYLHVSLETGVESVPDKLELPHRYWTKIGTAGIYDFRFNDGAELRYKPPHDEDTVKAALDQAYAIMLSRLRERAERIIRSGGL